VFRRSLLLSPFAVLGACAPFAYQNNPQYRAMVANAIPPQELPVLASGPVAWSQGAKPTFAQLLFVPRTPDVGSLGTVSLTINYLYLLRMYNNSIHTTRIAFDDIFAVRLAKDDVDYQRIEIDVNKLGNDEDDYTLSIEIHLEGWTTNSGGTQRQLTRVAPIDSARAPEMLQLQLNPKVLVRICP
jgi:hypothetical protein